MENILTPHFGLTFWTWVIFLSLVALLSKIAWGPMIRALDERESGIRKSLEDAASSQKAAADLKVRLEADLANAHQKAQTLLNEARQDALAVRDQLMKQAEADSRRILDQGRAELQEEKQKLTRELRKEVGVLSVQVAEKLLRHSMNGPEQQKLVDSLINDLGSSARKN